MRKLSIIAFTILLISLLCPVMIQAQENFIYFRNIDINDGLPSNTVTSIIQDDEGFLWFGTQVGLVRYDGYNYKIYKNDPKNNNSLPNNFIITLLEDSEGYIWIGTYGGGLSKFDKKHERFTNHVSVAEDETTISNNFIIDIYEDDDGKLWVGTHIGLSIYDKNTKKFTRILHDENNPNSLSDNTIYKIIKDSKGIYWIATRGGINKYNHKTKKFKAYKHDPNDPNSLSDNTVRNLLIDIDGTILAGTNNGGMSRFDPVTETFTRYLNHPNDPKSISHNFVRKMLLDKDNNLWVGTWGGGLNKYDRKNDNFIRYKKQPNSLFSIASDNVFGMFQDKTGTIWLGHINGGISYFNTFDAFITYQRDSTKENTLSNNFVRSAIEDDEGYIWLGTTHGLNRYDRKTDTYKHYFKDENDPNTVSDNDIYSLYQDSRGYIWIGTRNGGLNRFDKKTNSFKHYKHDPENPKSISNDNITRITEDSQGMLWIGTERGGVNKFDPETEIFTHYKPEEGNKKTLTHDWVRSVHIDKEGVLWVGTLGGLNRFNKEDGTFTQFVNDKNNPDSLNNNLIEGITHDNQNNLWLATAQGFTKFERDTGKFINYKKEFTTRSLTIDKNNEYLWAGTQKGIVRMNLKTEEMRVFTKTNGVYNDVSDKSTIVLNSGEILNTSTTGFTIIKPGKIKDDIKFPQTYLISLSIKEKTFQADKLIEYTDKVNLNWDENFFTFQFVSLEYIAPKNISYKYKLKGIDEDWVNSGTRLYGRYTNLPGGNYTLKVKSTNNERQWSDEQQWAVLSIKIDYPPWLRWWAFMFYGIGTLMLIFFIVLYIKNKFKKQLAINEKLHRVDRLKDEFLANTSHEFRTPLNGIIGIIDTLLDGITGKLPDETLENLNIIKHSSNRLLNLVNDILDFSKLKNNDLNIQKEIVDMYSISQTVITILKYINKNNAITIENNINKNESYVIGDENRLQQIMYNIIGNAVKFTEKGKVNVYSRKLNNNMLEFTVSDTGIGIDRDKLTQIFNAFEQTDEDISRKYGGTGLGLTVTKKLIEKHNGSIKVESQPGKGSSFIFTLPVAKTESKASEGETENDNNIINTQQETVEMMTTTNDNSKDDEVVNNETILIADDEYVNRFVLKNQLKLKGYNLIEAKNGYEVFETIFEKKLIPDLIILDIMMPEISGYKVCERIRETYSPYDLPILMLSAKTQPKDIITSLELGANDYLPKPFNKNELLARVSTLVKLKVVMGKLKELNNQLELKVIERTEELEATNNELEATNEELEATNIELMNEIERRQKAEENLEFERQQLYSILNSIDELIYVSDPNTYELLFTNNKFKEILGKGHIGEKCYKVIHNKDEVCDFCSNNKIKELDGRVYKWENYNHKTHRHYMIYDRLIKWPDGRDVRFEIAIDITEKKEAFEKLEKTMNELSIVNHELEHFSSIVAHDLKNPLSIIISSNSLLERELVRLGIENEDIQELLNMNVNTTRRLSKMIDNLLEYSRLGKNADFSRPIKIDNVIKIAINNLTQGIQKKDAVVSVENLPPSYVRGNETLLISLFQNLVGNALKYCDDKPEIIINSDKYGEDTDQWLFSVSDNGIGMDETQTDKIFQIFKRLHYNEEKYSGSGIGLAFCKKIVESHHGKIWVESEPGKGSTFYFTLPLYII